MKTEVSDSFFYAGGALIEVAVSRGSSVERALGWSQTTFN